MQSFLTDWNNDFSARMGHDNIRARHNLVDHPLFTDESLLRVLDEQPPEQLFIYTMGEPDDAEPLQFGRRGKLSADRLLEAVRTGRLWLNIIRVQDHHREWNELVEGLYADLARLNPGLHTYGHNANLLVSSPMASVTYHLDPPINMLWHVRGTKRVYTYPGDERFASQRNLELIFGQQTEEDLPYSADFDRDAQVYDLEPGEMLTWPQNIPHRVANTAGLNVSLSTEHYTTAAERKLELYLANHELHRWFKLPTTSTKTSGPIAGSKIVAWKAGKRFLKEAPRLKREPVFEVDPGSDRSVRWLQPAVADRVSQRG